jgi:hypothetical protein
MATQQAGTTSLSWADTSQPANTGMRWADRGHVANMSPLTWPNISVGAIRRFRRLPPVGGVRVGQPVGLVCADGVDTSHRSGDASRRCADAITWSTYRV